MVGHGVQCHALNQTIITGRFRLVDYYQVGKSWKYFTMVNTVVNKYYFENGGTNNSTILK